MDEIVLNVCHQRNNNNNGCDNDHFPPSSFSVCSGDKGRSGFEAV
jgi:hypothetical protein